MANILRQIQKLLITILLANPFNAYKVNIFKVSDLTDFSLQSNFDENFHSNNNNLMPTILVNNDKIPEAQTHDSQNDTDASGEHDTILTSDIKSNLFPKPGSSYSEKTERKSRGSSKKKSSLTFKQEITIRNGREKPPRGGSDPTDSENLRNFEKAGIPIDPMKNRNKKPDDYNEWHWDKKQKKWIIVGEPKIKLSNGKIIKQAEWRNMIINNSNQI